MYRLAAIAVYLEALGAAQGVAIPNIRKTMRTIELCPHAGPLLTSRWRMPVDRKIWATSGVAVPVGIFLKPDEHFGRGEIPEMSLIKIFACSYVGCTTSFVRFSQGEARALPFPQEPCVERQAIDAWLINVLNTDLRDNRKAPNFGGIHVAGNVLLAFIPDVGVDVAPAVRLENWMDSSPPDFAVPKPQSCEGGGVPRPSCNVRPVPLWKPKVIRCIALKPEDSITAV